MNRRSESSSFFSLMQKWKEKFTRRDSNLLNGREKALVAKMAQPTIPFSAILHNIPWDRFQGIIKLTRKHFLSGVP